MDTPVQEMQPAQLLQEFSDRLRAVDRMSDKIDRRAEELEQEILRRMAW